MNPPTASQTLAAMLKPQRGRVVAHLAHALGLSHLALAEDAVHGAVLRALEHWPAQGVPQNPAGWLFQVARHIAIDALRVQGRHVEWPEPGDAEAALLPVHEAATGRFTTELDDEELALLFAACHPSLPPASQVALALRALAGLDLGTIAAGLLCSEAALAQRLARARVTLSGQSLHIPAGHELPPRREAVLTALSLAFHCGVRRHTRSGTEDAATGAADREKRPQDLCWEAIRLARGAAAHPAVAHAEVDALAAMLLFHGARLTGQVDANGDIVMLPGQPRDRWDAGMVRMGLAHLQAAQRAQRLSRWHLLAGIAAEHALAPDYASTDWAAIVRYYETLLRLDESPAPRLAHAIALAEGGQPHRALELLTGLQRDVPRALQAHALAAQSRAHERLGAVAPAVELLEQAAACAPHPADARMLAHRAKSLMQPP